MSDESRSRSPSKNKGKHNSGSPDKIDHDSLSIYIGNVDYSATEEELRDAFLECGDIVRVTIIKNMKTGHPKGAAFIEFTKKDGVNAAMDLNGKEVKGRQMIVTMKKPRPDPRERDYERDRGASSYYDRFGYPRSEGRSRGPPRSVPAYNAYPDPRPYRGPYGPGPMPRGGYYPEPRDQRDPYDNRRPSHMHMPVEPHLQPRYDPYRRPDFYDPYMGGGPRGMQPSHYYPIDPRNKVDPRMDPRGYRGEPVRGDPRNESKGYHRIESASKGDPRHGEQPKGGEYGRTNQRNGGDYRK